MRFRFDPNQEYQLEAIRSVADLFDGQPVIRGGMQFKSGTVALSAFVIGNPPSRGAIAPGYGAPAACHF